MSCKVNCDRNAFSNLDFKVNELIVAEICHDIEDLQGPKFCPDALPLRQAFEQN